MGNYIDYGGLVNCCKDFGFYMSEMVGVGGNEGFLSRHDLTYISTQSF